VRTQRLEPLYIAGGNVNGAVTMENSLTIPQKASTELRHEPATPLLRTYTKELKTRTNTDTCALTQQPKDGHNSNVLQQMEDK
jgi:hypothetical protein